MTADETTLRMLRHKITFYEMQLEETKKILREDKIKLEQLLEDHQHLAMANKMCEFCDERVICQTCDNPYDQDKDSFGICSSCWDRKQDRVFDV